MRRKHINLGGESYIPNESTQNQALKKDASPNRKDLTVTYDNLNLKSHLNFPEALD